MLDLVRSDKLSAHLEALGLPELARSAAERIEFAMQIAHSRGGSVHIVQTSALGTKERHLTFGEEHRENGRDGALIRMVAEELPGGGGSGAGSLGAGAGAGAGTGAVVGGAGGEVGIGLTVDWGGRARIVETKRLEGEVLVQEISMTLLANPNRRTKTVRFWHRGQATEDLSSRPPLVLGV